MSHPAGDRATSAAWCSVVGIPWALGSSGCACTAVVEERVFPLCTTRP